MCFNVRYQTPNEQKIIQHQKITRFVSLKKMLVLATQSIHCQHCLLAQDNVRIKDKVTAQFTE